jgi:hypothetical protein
MRWNLNAVTDRIHSIRIPIIEQDRPFARAKAEAGMQTCCIRVAVAPDDEKTSARDAGPGWE